MVRVMLTTGNMGFGGVETRVSLLAQGLVERGVYEPVVCCLVDSGLGGLAPKMVKAGVPMVQIPRRGQDWRHYVQDFANTLREQEIDILHVNMLRNLTAQLIGSRLGRLRGTILTMPCSATRRTLSALKMCVTTLAPFRLVDVYTANSCASKALVRYAASLGRRQVRVIHNAVDVTFFRPGVFPQPEARESLGLPARARVVGFISRLSPSKGPGILLAAATQVLRSQPDVVFAFAGGHRVYLPALKAEAQSLGLGDVALFIGWADDARVFYSAIDLLAFPSFSEGLPNVVLEAMASGLPIVGSDHPGVVEALGDAGMIVPTGNPKALANAIVKVLSDPQLTQQMSRAALDRAGQFTVSGFLDGYEAVYRDVLEKGSRSW